MALNLTKADSLRLHREMVEAALREVIGLKAVDGVPSEAVVARFYNKFERVSGDLLLHRDPLGLAFDLAGKSAPPPSDDDFLFRERFIALQEEIMGNFFLNRFEPG